MKLDENFWQPVIRHLHLFTKYYGEIYHGQEVVGFEKVPKNSKALLIGFHGTSLSDINYIHSKYFLEAHKHGFLVIDNAFFNLPAMKPFLQLMKYTPGTHEVCVDILNRENMLMLLPGGAREALFGYQNYELMWEDRKGFARIANEAKAVKKLFPSFFDFIPTVNSRFTPSYSLSTTFSF